MTLDWADGAGELHHERLWLGPETTVFQTPAEAVRWVAPDPVGGVLAHWTRTQGPSEWITQACLQDRQVVTERLATGRARDDHQIVAGARGFQRANLVRVELFDATCLKQLHDLGLEWFVRLGKGACPSWQFLDMCDLLSVQFVSLNQAQKTTDVHAQSNSLLPN